GRKTGRDGTSVDGGRLNKKVLIVDDSAMSRRMLSRILESAGHSVIQAEDGAGGLEMFFLEKPDLVFLDLTMKDMYGLDVLGKIREIDPGARIIIASADIQDQTRDMVNDAGANAFVNKPLSPEKVLSAVESAFSDIAAK
ncbi:MAG TPA: response regulator, partial [Pyrinomonadaceae bacterium]|nr:response regulator [Pyrinomonadaceae bacterium]